MIVVKTLSLFVGQTEQNVSIRSEHNLNATSVNTSNLLNYRLTILKVDKLVLSFHDSLLVKMDLIDRMLDEVSSK